jgi:hypothetical protein
VVLGLVDWRDCLLIRVPNSQVSDSLLSDRGRLLGKFGPLGGLDTAWLGLKEQVGDLDLAACPIGLLAPSCPGRADAVVSVKGSFDG